MKFPDPVKVIGFFIPIPILFFVVGLKWWGWFFIGVGAFLAAVEIASFLVKGKSISRQFWEWNNKKMKYLIVGAWVLFALYLAAHLLWEW